MVLQYSRFLVLAACASTAVGWSSSPLRVTTRRLSSSVELHMNSINNSPENNEIGSTTTSSSTRRSFVSTLAAIGTVMTPALIAQADDGEEAFGSIAERAAKLSKAVELEQDSVEPQQKMFESADTRTAFDFSLPVQGEAIPFTDLIKQDFGADVEGEKVRPRVKAILVVNIKQDDIIARKNIPELIALAAKYGRNGDLAIVCSPTDQGYYEPDTSQLLRMKVASEYGYGINPSTILTDKVNLLGTGCHPFWRWLEGNCRTPAGLGKVEQNFEKFLIDGTTGLPLRRYPRKYQPRDIQNDIESVIAGRKLAPAGANYNEEWRQATIDAEREVYRFQKGLNYFDQ